MYNLATKEASLVGEDLGNGKDKWLGGSTNSTDGIIYCMPYNADRILAIHTNRAYTKLESLPQGASLMCYDFIH